MNDYLTQLLATETARAALAGLAGAVVRVAQLRPAWKEAVAYFVSAPIVAAFLWPVIPGVGAMVGLNIDEEMPVFVFAFLAGMFAMTLVNVLAAIVDRKADQIIQRGESTKEEPDG